MITVGASGAVFAVFGALYYLSRAQPHRFDASSRSTLNIMILLNVVATFIFADVSISGHVGGLIAGFALAYLLKVK